MVLKKTERVLTGVDRGSLHDHRTSVTGKKVQTRDEVPPEIKLEDERLLKSEDGDKGRDISTIFEDVTKENKKFRRLLTISYVIVKKYNFLSQTEDNETDRGLTVLEK